MDVNDPARTRAALAALWTTYRETLLARVDVLDDAVIAVLEERLDRDGARTAAREAHKLAGSLGSFGIAEGSRVARELEHALEVPEGIDLKDALRISELVVALRRLIEDGPPATPEQAEETQTGPARVLVVCADAEYANSLLLEATASGFEPVVTGDYEEALPHAERPFVAAILDLEAAPAYDESLETVRRLVEALRARAYPLLIGLASTSALDHRVAFARVGGGTFLNKPQPAARVLRLVRERAPVEAAPEPATILLVDDDEAILAQLSTIVREAGMTPVGLGDPTRFWDVLEETDPDLLVLDIDMPGIDGIDLCQVVRAAPRWARLPIFFITSRTHPSWIEKIFAAGADDFVSKPVIGPEVVSRIRNRLARVEHQRTAAVDDSSGGLLDRRLLEASLTRAVALARELERGFAFVLFAVEGLDALRQAQGRAAGERVVDRVASVLQVRFSDHEIVGRWAEDGFAIGLPEASRADARSRIVDALGHATLAAREAAGGFEGVGLRAGVAVYPGDGETLPELVDEALAALGTAIGGEEHLVAAATLDGRAVARPLDLVVVEDDEVLGALLVHALESRGYEYEWIRDGRAAVNALAGDAPSLRPRAMLLDVGLPGLDGLSVLRQLARDGLTERIRIIMLTARTAESEVLAALELGAYDHVAKPFSVPVLLHRIQRALEP